MITLACTFPFSPRIAPRRTVTGNTTRPAVLRPGTTTSAAANEPLASTAKPAIKQANRLIGTTPGKDMAKDVQRIVWIQRIGAISALVARQPDFVLLLRQFHQQTR